MTVYLQRIGALVAGTTGLAYGTALTPNLPAQAKHVLGMVVVGADPTYTTAEGAATLLRISSSSLGLSNETFLTGPYTTSGPGTNGSGQGMVQDIIKTDWSCNGGERLTIDAAPTNTITTARLLEVMLMYKDHNPIPKEWLDAFPGVAGIRGSQVATAAQLTVAPTALTALTIPSWAKYICGYRAFCLKTAAITGGEEGLGYFDISSNIKGAAPQEVPTNATGATLGTPVGTGQYLDKLPWIPAYVELTGKEETVTPRINLRTAVTTGNQVGIQIAYR